MKWIVLIVSVTGGMMPGIVSAKPVATHTPRVMTDPRAAQFLAANALRPGVVTTASGLQYSIIDAVSGDRPGRDEIATVDYTGTLPNGAVFVRGMKVDLYVADQVPGLSEALMLMPLNAHYRFWMSPTIAHGMRAKPGIPAGSVVIYDVMLRDFRNKASDGPEQE
jgi:FKBP-type peptidyl-prolyl cis-trans isomerase